MDYYSSAFRRYADFQGRASRAEFWVFMLCHIVVLTALGGLVAWSTRLGFLLSLYFLATLVPLLAVGCRRLHDQGKSGALQLLGLLPFGVFVVLVLMTLPGSSASNGYGSDPRGQRELLGGTRF
jgi:uncharacterized membrane protein YhaH (DUF805 family)